MINWILPTVLGFTLLILVVITIWTLQIYESKCYFLIVVDKKTVCFIQHDIFQSPGSAEGVSLDDLKRIESSKC